MSLTGEDLRIIDQARELAGLSADAVEQRGPHYVVGHAQDVIRQLVAIISRLDDEDDHWRDYDYTCSACGARIGIFTGREGWHHYRGEGTAASPVEVYDAGHEAVPAQVTETSGG